jgi:predicted HD phosphohydrolase
VSNVQATCFKEATAGDWELLVATGNAAYVEEAGDGHLQMLAAQQHNSTRGWQINNYQHSLQCATRALRAGESEEFVITALFHDLAQDFYPYIHDQMSAKLLEPYLSDENLWIVANHQVFQLSFRTHSRFDRTVHEKHKDNPFFDRARYFCEHYDQNCFDPDYVHEPLETFAPMVKAHFSACMQDQLKTF